MKGWKELSDHGTVHKYWPPRAVPIPIWQISKSVSGQLSYNLLGGNVRFDHNTSVMMCVNQEYWSGIGCFRPDRKVIQTLLWVRLLSLGTFRNILKWWGFQWDSRSFNVYYVGGPLNLYFSPELCKSAVQWQTFIPKDLEEHHNNENSDIYICLFVQPVSVFFHKREEWLWDGINHLQIEINSSSVCLLFTRRYILKGDVNIEQKPTENLLWE